MMAPILIAAIDAAAVADPTPATATVTWGALLCHAAGFNGKLNGRRSTLDWKTSSENGSDHSMWKEVPMDSHPVSLLRSMQRVIVVSAPTIGRGPGAGEGAELLSP